MLKNEAALDWPEQKKLFEKLQDAEGDTRREIIDRLWVANVTLVERFVTWAGSKDRRFGGLLQQELDDLWADCVLLLRKSIDDFKLKKGIPFDAFVKKRFLGPRKAILRGAIKRERMLREEKKRLARAMETTGKRGKKARPIEVNPESAEGDVSNPADGIEPPRTTDYALANLPLVLTRSGGWEALAAVLNDAKEAGLFNRWKTRQRLMVLGDEPVEAVTEPQPDALLSLSGSTVERRWRFWKVMVP